MVPAYSSCPAVSKISRCIGVSPMVICFLYESADVGSYSSTKSPYMNCSVNALLPTPPAPTTIILCKGSSFFFPIIMAEDDRDASKSKRCRYSVLKRQVSYLYLKVAGCLCWSQRGKTRVVKQKTTLTTLRSTYLDGRRKAAELSTIGIPPHVLLFSSGLHTGLSLNSLPFSNRRSFLGPDIPRTTKTRARWCLYGGKRNSSPRDICAIGCPVLSPYLEIVLP